MNQSLINKVLVCARFFLPNMFLIGVLFSISAVGEALSSDAFMQPNNDYLPKTWMHAMNGNLSKEGFSEDFKALEEAGIGGAIFFHVHRRNWPYSSRGRLDSVLKSFMITLSTPRHRQISTILSSAFTTLTDGHQVVDHGLRPSSQ